LIVDCGLPHIAPVARLQCLGDRHRDQGLALPEAGKNYLTNEMLDAWGACFTKCGVLCPLQVAAFAEHTKRIWSVDFSATDPQRFLSGSDDGTVRLWSINDQVHSRCSWELRHLGSRGRRDEG
jgi:hypothetical protein